MKCLRYPEYKTTGFKWLGEVPSHWGVGRTSRYFQIAMGETILQENLEEDGTWPVFSATDGDQYLGKVSNPRVRLFPGDIVIPARGNSIGAVKLVREAATTSQTTIYCKRISPEKFISEYVFFFMRGCRANLFYFTQTAIPQITVGEVGANPILVPPILEQQAIVDFLDQETSKIDALISEQQRLIELLKEKRQAVISHAVTKGLNPDVRMKPSGVEWLGEVPEHWEVQRLRFVARLNPSKSEQASIPKETLVSFLPMPAIGEDGRLNLEQQKPIGELEQGYSYFREGDVSIAKITPCFENGKGAVMANLTNGVGFGTTELIVVRPLSDRVTGPYLHHLFVSAQFRRLGESAMYGAGGQKRVPDDFVRNFEVAIPPKSEQQFIVATLEKRISSIDELVLEAEKGIYLLQERRTALISAAVTGKIDVRNYAATQKDAA